MSAEVAAALSQLGGLDERQTRRLTPLFTLVEFAAETEIFAPGGRASRLYVLLAGMVTLRVRPYDGGSLDIAQIGPGGAFGWSAALGRAHYTATASAATAVKALAIEASRLRQLMADDPETSNQLLERAAQIAGNQLEGLGRQVLDLLRPGQAPAAG
jgi:CRP-like cAMP-binding protein